jgi:hypothetical protein
MLTLLPILCVVLISGHVDTDHALRVRHDDRLWNHSDYCDVGFVLTDQVLFATRVQALANSNITEAALLTCFSH